MFKITPNGTNRLDIEFGGKLDSEDMKQALDELTTKSEGIENGRMLYRVHDFNLPTLGALGVELTRMPEMFKMIRRFNRAAILCDKSWIRKAGEIEGMLIPWLQIKAFEPEEFDAAEAWLNNES